jgi:2-C-methyl-D-erythritol 4-phosphate cytidylyltransferase
LKQKGYLITHDAVRPFISQKIIEDNIIAIESFDAVDTVIPAIDTIVESTDGTIINNIPKRDNMYMGQTPQTVNIKQFISLYSSLTEEQKNQLSDAAKIFVINNKKVGIVQGTHYNIKITTMYDLKIANAILNEGVKTE